MGRNRDVSQWKQDFDAQPRVFWTETHDGDPTGNFYDSKEGALAEVRWKKARRERVYVCSAPLHSLDLSQRRWREEPSDDRP